MQSMSSSNIRAQSSYACRFQRYKPEQVMVPREVFLTYIAPVHYNGIRRAPVSACTTPPVGTAFRSTQSDAERILTICIY